MLDGLNTASYRKWYKDFFSDLFDELDNRFSGVDGGGDIEKDQLIGPLVADPAGQPFADGIFSKWPILRKLNQFL